MNILFVHQSFPGQYRHIVRALASQGAHNIVGLGIYEPSEPIPPGVKYIRYPLSRGNSNDLHPWLVDLDSKLIRGEGCVTVAEQLKKQGFTPDIICAHPGWGESLFLGDIWPSSPILSYQEFFYNPRGFDSDFDIEIQSQQNWKDHARIRLKNANPLISLNSSTWNVTPTIFQHSSFPSEYQHRISVIHDGIDTALASPQATPPCLDISSSLRLSKDQKIITFVNRRLEPYRGCHSFIRSIPYILSSHPDAYIIIVGETEGVSYGAPPPEKSWKDIFLSEIKGTYDESRVVFAGSLPYATFLHLLRLSSCHVYLTYPFVLSWSLLEAMSTSLPVVASSTPPVLEIINDGETGVLVDFFKPEEIASACSRILSNPRLAQHLGSNARQHILSNYSLERCVSLHLSLINLTASSCM